MKTWLTIWLALALYCTAAEPAYVDDRALLNALTRQVQQLNEAKKLTPFKLLREQLGRTECRVPLPAPPQKPLAAPELYRRAQESVLIHCHLFLCGKCSKLHVNASTCFPLTADGICVANYHSFTNSNTVAMAVATRDGRVFPVTEVLAVSRRDDTVIFRAATDKLAPLGLASAEVGEPVAVLSHPSGRFYVFTQGAVARYCLDGGAPRMHITADYAVGSSGGPVLNAAGAVVGMVASTQDVYAKQEHGQHDNLQMVVKLCVPASSIRKLIKE
jgi:hypothetical protein